MGCHGSAKEAKLHKYMVASKGLPEADTSFLIIIIVLYYCCFNVIVIIVYKP